MDLERNGHFSTYLLPVVCSMALLLVFGICINPVVSSSSSAYAEGGESGQGGDIQAGGVQAGDVKVASDIVPENGVALRIDTALDSNNTVEEQVVGSGTQYIKVDFTVGANNIQNYDVYVQADSTALTGASHGDKLQSINGNSVGTVGAMQWGYSVERGDVEPSTMTYKPIQTSVSTSADGQDAGEGKTLTGISQPYTLAFAANLEGATADHYKSNITLSVAAEAGETTKTWDDMVYMQDMNAAACASQATPAAGDTTVPTKTLIDSRDKTSYTIAKLKDGNCWMTQNLRLIGERVLTPEDSDIDNFFFLPAPVTISSDDSPKKFSSSDQYQLRVYYADNTSRGAYYNWYTATARTGDASITSETAPNSICPKGWRLPTGGNNTGEFYTLLDGLSVNAVARSPYSFEYSGYVSSSTLYNADRQGYYWSSTASSSTNAYVLNFYTSSVKPSGSEYRHYGSSVRCVAR